MVKISSAVIRGLTVQAVEVSVVTRRGVPRFEWFGVPAALAKSWKEKISVLAHNLEVPLKNQIISISTSLPITTQDQAQLELAVVIAVFSVLLGKEHSTEPFFLGSIDLDGQVRKSSGLEAVAQTFQRPVISGGDAHTGNSHIFIIFTITDVIKFLAADSRVLQQSLAKEKDPPDLGTDHSWLFQPQNAELKLLTQLIAATGYGVGCFDWQPTQLQHWLSALQACLPSRYADQQRYLASLNQTAGKPPVILSLLPHQLKTDLTPTTLAKAHGKLLHLAEVERLDQQTAHRVRHLLSTAAQEESYPFPLKPLLVVSGASCACGEQVHHRCHCSSATLFSIQKIWKIWEALTPFRLPRAANINFSPFSQFKIGIWDSFKSEILQASQQLQEQDGVAEKLAKVLELFDHSQSTSEIYQKTALFFLQKGGHS